MRIIVTGASGTLGEAVVRRYAAAGDRIAAIGRHAGHEGELNGRFAGGDLGDETAAQEVVDRAIAWLGGLDALVHVAGGFRWIEMEVASLSDWRALFDANVATSVACVGAALPFLQTGGAITLIGASSATSAVAGFGPYAAAKSGVARLTEALSAELWTRGIRVNAVLPGIIDTPRNRTDMPDVDPSDWTRPEAIADVIAFLTSAGSRAINGALIPVTNAA